MSIVGKGKPTTPCKFVHSVPTDVHRRRLSRRTRSAESCLGVKLSGGAHPTDVASLLSFSSLSQHLQSFTFTNSTHLVRPASTMSSAPELEIRLVKTPEDLAVAHAIRFRVFVDEEHLHATPEEQLDE